MPQLTSAGVSVFVNNQSVYPQPFPTTIPVLFLATRANKSTPDGAGTALGTTESNRLREVASPKELLQNYGNPIFVTANGDPVHGDETNEYGLLAAHSFMQLAPRAFIMRANIDLGQIVPTNVEPVLPPPDGTYWINKDSVIGGIFTRSAGNWVAVPFTVYTTAPASGDGNDGDWAFDYSTLDGTLKFKSGGNWYAATTANIQTVLGATNPLFISGTAPGSPTNGDFWYKTTSGSGGTNLQLGRFRAADQVWLTQPIIRSSVAPTPVQYTIWEDTSQISVDGTRPLRVGTGASFIQFDVFVQDNPPVTEPDTGTLWYDDNITDFALYIEDGNVWVAIETVTTLNPTNRQKVISASAPRFPNLDSIWVDVSTPEARDNFPVIKRWSGTQWIDISASVLVTAEDPIATLVADGTYWLNLGESITRNTIKRYNPDFVALKVVSGSVVTEVGNHWEPAAGDTFGRKAQREVVVEALQAAIVASDELRAEDNYYQLISCPGYPELYNEMFALNTDNQEISFIVADTPKFMRPSGIPVGREITASEWITNARNAATTGEEGFTSGRTPYSAVWSPWGLGTNVDGQNVFVPPSHIALRTIAFSDSVAAPWFPAAGPARGRVDNVESVGYLNNDGEYVPVKLNRSQRSILYEKNINPIAFIPSIGLTVWGQKTLSPIASALDRINVARLIVKMKYDLMRLLEAFLFEINDAITRRSAQVVTERYCAGLKSLRAVYDYAVRCDESNNTGDRIDRNELWVDVAIKPAKAIEFIYVPITILATGDQLPF